MALAWGAGSEHGFPVRVCLFDVVDVMKHAVGAVGAVGVWPLNDRGSVLAPTRPEPLAAGGHQYLLDVDRQRLSHPSIGIFPTDLFLVIRPDYPLKRWLESILPTAAACHEKRPIGLLRVHVAAFVGDANSPAFASSLVISRPPVSLERTLGLPVVYALAPQPYLQRLDYY